MSTVIKVENLSKQYRLGNVGTGSLAHDLNRSWHRLRGKEDPYLKIGEANDRAVKGSSDYVWALQNINFEVQQGEVLGIIGRNGAGKSTLLKILSRTTTPSTGSIKIKGRVASLLEVGTGFHPELTGRENIFLNGAILGMTKKEIKSKFDEIVDFAGVERYIDTPVKRYSSGMYVRLAFGVAAHLEPEILIVDEVLAVGDAEFQKKALGKMKDVSGKDGRTVLFVSHNMAAIENLCTKGMLLNQGNIYFNGSIENTIQNYTQNSFERKNTKLENRTDRKGNGEVRITNYYFKDQSGEEINILKIGSCFELILELKKNKTIKIQDLRIDVAIIDEYDSRLIVMSNDFISQKIDSCEDNFKIIFTIDRLALNIGEYSLVFFLKVNNEISDWIDQVGFFTVEAGDFYNTGKLNLSSQGKFLFDYTIRQI